MRVNIAMRSVKRRALNSSRELHQLLERAEKLKASIRAKVEHPFRLIKQQFGYAMVRYRGLKKNTERLTMPLKGLNIRPERGDQGGTSTPRNQVITIALTGTAASVFQTIRNIKKNFE